MKNTDNIPFDLEMIIAKKIWKCGCGQEGLRLSITRKGSVQAHCFKCGQTIFFNDVNIFRAENPWAIYQQEKPIIKNMVNGGWTYWYPKSRVRKFVLPP